MIKLWGRTTSSNVMKVMWLLDELGIAYERVDVGGSFGGTATPQYRAMQPLGLVPAIEDGEFTLFESNTIMRYICNAYAPASGLYPAEPRARASVEALMDFQQTALNRPQTVVFIGLIRTAPEKRDTAAIAAGATEAGRIWSILDARLAGHAYLVGEGLTLADMVFGMHAHRWYAMDVPGRPETPQVAAWYKRLMARPAFVKHCAITPT